MSVNHLDTGFMKLVVRARLLSLQLKSRLPLVVTPMMHKLKRPKDSHLDARGMTRRRPHGLLQMCNGTALDLEEDAPTSQAHPQAEELDVIHGR